VAKILFRLIATSYLGSCSAARFVSFWVSASLFLFWNSVNICASEIVSSHLFQSLRQSCSGSRESPRCFSFVS